jgi:hypothetical protein
MLSTLVQQNVRLSEVIVADILGSDHLPLVLSIVQPVRKKESLDPVEKFTDWKLFQSLASELMLPNIQIHSSNEVDKVVRDITANIAYAYRLSTRKTKILDRK